MARDVKTRVVAFVSASVADQYMRLSRRFGISRSELFRMALQRGYKSIAAWCERTREDFVAGEVAESGSVPSSSDPVPAASAAPVAKLSDYGRVLVDQDPDLGVDQVRAMLMAQSAVFGVPADEVDELVAAVIEQLFPAEVGGSGEGDGGGGGVELD